MVADWIGNDEGWGKWSGWGGFVAKVCVEALVWYQGHKDSKKGQKKEGSGLTDKHWYCTILNCTRIELTGYGKIV